VLAAIQQPHLLSQRLGYLLLHYGFIK
jgi:hypothetical protein